MRIFNLLSECCGYSNTTSAVYLIINTINILQDSRKRNRMGDLKMIGVEVKLWRRLSHFSNNKKYTTYRKPQNRALDTQIYGLACLFILAHT